MDFSSDEDKRDLLIVFGEDERIQKKDSFFHNANSIIKRDVWEKINFNNKVENIEDRIWAGEILKKNYKIKYTPKHLFIIIMVYINQGIVKDLKV